MSCHHVPRTIASLRRYKSRPLRLRLGPQSSTVALNDVLLHGNEVASLTISPNPEQIPLLHQLLVFPRPSMKQLHIYSERQIQWDAKEQGHDIPLELPSLRELFLCRFSIPVDRLSAPNLVHLALEDTEGTRNVASQSILGVLRGCPRLKTLLIVNSGAGPLDPTRDHPPVSLPNLRSLELGSPEVHLTAYLQFPPNVAVGFRKLGSDSVFGCVSPIVMAAMQRVLGRINIHRITLARHIPLGGDMTNLIRFEGQRASLEITTKASHSNATLLTPGGVLFSRSLGIENTKELQIIGYYFHNRLVNNQGWFHINSFMPNLVSISFFRCKERDMFVPLTPTDHSSPPFPHLNHVMVLGEGPGLREMVKARRDYGVPLKTLMVGQRPRGSENDHLEPYAAREEYVGDHPEDWAGVVEFVGDLRVGCPTEIVQWGDGNEIMNFWSTVGVPGPVSQNQNLMIPD